MRVIESGWRTPWLLFILLTGASVVPHGSYADDDGDKNASNPSAKPADAKKIETPAPGLTEREAWLLEQVVELKKRVAELESKANPAGTASPSTTTAQPGPSKSVDLHNTTRPQAQAGPLGNPISAEARQSTSSPSWLSSSFSFISGGVGA